MSVCFGQLFSIAINWKSSSKFSFYCSVGKLLWFAGNFFFWREILFWSLKDATRRPLKKLIKFIVGMAYYSKTLHASFMMKLSNKPTAITWDGPRSLEQCNSLRGHQRMKHLWHMIFFRFFHSSENMHMK